MLGRGRFALVVYGHDDRHSVMATHMLDPLEVRNFGSSYLVNHDSVGTKPLREIEWPEIVPLEQVVLGARHYFRGHYPEDEAEDVFCLEFSDDLIWL